MSSSITSSFGFIILSFVIQAISADYVPADYTLLDIGQPGYSMDSDKRIWSSIYDSGNTKLIGRSVPATAVGRDGLIDDIPFLTARISDSQFSLSISVKEPGRKFVRLYFYTSNYDDFDITNANFHIVSDSFTLMRNFAPADLGPSCLVIEYSIPVLTGTLNLDFIPNFNIRNSFAFINGVEILSHPDDLYTGTTILVGEGTSFIIDNNTALENVARFNVGDYEISINDDSGLYRFWDDDKNWVFGGQPGIQVDAGTYKTIVTYPPNIPTYIAPELVYQTARSMGPDFGFNLNYNMTWLFPVDSGFYYLVRLHLCEVLSSIDKVNERVFNIYINNQLAESGADLIAWTGKPGVPAYKDYVVVVPESPESKQDLSLSMAPDASSNSKYYDTLLNGVEIFKISDFHRSLAGHDPKPVPENLESRKRKMSRKRMIGVDKTEH